MRDSTRHRSLATAFAARQAVLLVLACCLVVSCVAGEDSGDHSAGTTPASPEAPADRASPPSDRSSSDDADRAVPTVPTTHNAIALARRLDDAAATLRDRRAAAADIRKAGEFQQLAVRTLADSPGEFRRRVIDRLHPAAALVIRGCVRAARSLQTISSPAHTMPKWQVVAPLPPARLLGYYRDAQRRTGVHWTYLAAINLVETRMGRIRGESTVGARGPMQFLPTTWDRYGAGGNINDSRDAILAAARLLRANGAPDDMRRALWHYNPSAAYTRAVSAYARTMQRSRWAYLGYWHWRVLYSHERATYLLPVGYPETPALPLEPKSTGERG
jgi:membrane-bound lytic murein transglycosylase B